MTSTTLTPFDFDRELDDDLAVCTGLSIEHADGTTECEHADCPLPHELHLHVAGCSEFATACSCSPDDGTAWLLAA